MLSGMRCHVSRLGVTKIKIGMMQMGQRQVRFFQDRKPGPPPLPKEEQEEFEKLQKLAQSQEAIDEYNAQFESDQTKESVKSPFLKNDIGSFSPEFMKTIPEFEGEKNPVTGEIGGPKQDPLRHGDYSFNGRVTDF